MMRSGFVVAVGSLLFMAGATHAQEPIPAELAPAPTISLEAVAVNDIPIPNGPTRKLTMAIGDVVTCKLFLRDWSPNGEALRAYQIKLDDASFATGDQGVIQPVDFQANPENDPNALIDEKDPQWVHQGLKSIAITDTVSAGYRYLSVLEDPKVSPTSAQNAQKYVCGMVRMTASSNAKGTYQLGVYEDPLVSGVITPDSENVIPMEYEKLAITIAPTTQWRRMLASEPPNGSVDARRASKGREAAGAWDRITLKFNAASADLSTSDLLVEDGTTSPPKIKKITGDGPNAIIELERGIRSGAWTTITHKSSNSTTRVGFFPGDVNADGKTGSGDVDLLIRALNRSETLPMFRSDVDGDGALSAGDLLGLLDLVATGPSKRSATSPR